MRWPVFIKAVILVLLVYGCIPTAPPKAPPPPRVPTRTENKATDRLIKGIRAYEDGRYDDAASFFRDIISSNLGTPLLMEAQWHLAMSYIAAGKNDEAKKELHLFLNNYRGSPYEEEARLLLHQQELSAAKSIAIVWAPEKTPSLKDLLLRFPNVTINTVLLEISDSQLKKSAQAPSKLLPNDPLSDWIGLAREMGLRVFLITPLRFTASYQISTPAGEADIFNPEVKKGVLTFYRDITRYPVHGIYVNEIAYGVKEGWTPYAMAAYEEAFFEKLDVDKVFKKGGGTPSAGGVRSERRLTTAPLLTDHSPSFWRFVGLKARHLSKLLNEVWDQIQSDSPEIEFGISVPEILLIDPAKGLVETSLDYLELKESQFDFYVVGSMGSGAQKVSEFLLKYGRIDNVWFHRTRKEAISALLEMPIQGIIVSSP